MSQIITTIIREKWDRACHLLHHHLCEMGQTISHYYHHHYYGEFGQIMSHIAIIICVS